MRGCGRLIAIYSNYPNTLCSTRKIEMDANERAVTGIILILIGKMMR